ncbi:MAG: hypothetical protein WC992_03870 [Acholeplasmataceae bacterium]|jgi:hypothetical protein
MADDWIKVRTTIHEQREVVLIAKRLGLIREHVVGLVVRFWGWADANTADGNLPHMAAGDVDDIVGQVGFAEAMIEAGWLLADPGGLILPNFTRHNGTTAKQRGLATRRQQEKRAREAGQKI